jgi:hypothetical protein
MVLTASWVAWLQKLQQLKPPEDTVRLLDVYEFCGYSPEGEELTRLYPKVDANMADLEGECKALRLVLAAAKEAGDVQVCIFAVACPTRVATPAHRLTVPGWSTLC